MPPIPLLRLAALLLCLLPAAPAFAQHLGDFLPQVTPAELVPGADRFGPPEGSPPVAPAYAGARLVGWAYLNTDFTNASGYSGWPIHILVGLTSDWRIGGARLMEHHEPLLLSGIGADRIEAVLRSYAGLEVTGITSIAAYRPREIISGATVSMMVIGDSILRSAVLLVRRHRPEPPSPAPVAAPAEEAAPAADWATLRADGALRHLHLSVGEVSRTFAAAGFQAAASRPERADPDADFIDLYAAVVSLPRSGRSLLGEAGYARLRAALVPGQQAIALFANGLYAYKGAEPRVGAFARFALLQGERTIRFTDREQRRLDGAAAAGAPGFTQADLFLLPAGSVFDPAAPWRLQLLTERDAGGRPAFVTFDLAGPLSGLEPAAAVPLWQAQWREAAPRIAVLAAALLLLTAIFFAQDRLARHPRLQHHLRLAFLAFTLLWIGGYAQAQLSVVNLLTFLSALRADFRWDAFLMAPLVFILGGATALALLFWNRGAFCGWLCPYGAAQELLNRAARVIGLRQVALPFGLHQRLTALKYVVFLALFGLSLHALASAERAAEIEPFKTVFVLHFARTWPYVLYAAAPLAIGLVIERFFCRYLCPLGAALAIPARLRLFDWLARRRECGNPCRRCAEECPVQAIGPEGVINPAECIQCLHCQMLYHHDQRCPVLIRRHHKQRRRVMPADSVGD